MASLMSRIFSPAPAPVPQGSMPIQNPGANPVSHANQPTGTSANGPAVKTVPLDEFKDIWQPVKAEDNVDPFSKPLLTHDPVKLREAVGRMNFAEGIDPALLTKALAGDTTALMQAINAASQKAFEASVGLNSSMIEGSFKTNNERVNSTLPKKIREQQVNSTKSDNPVLNHEAASPMLSMAKQAIMAKNPDLNPSQVQARAEQYLLDFAGSLVGQQEASKTPTVDPYDFSSMG